MSTDDTSTDVCGIWMRIRSNFREYAVTRETLKNFASRQNMQHINTLTQRPLYGLSINKMPEAIVALVVVHVVMIVVDHQLWLSRTTDLITENEKKYAHKQPQFRCIRGFLKKNKSPNWLSCSKVLRPHRSMSASIFILCCFFISCMFFRCPEDGVIGGDVSRCRVFCSAGLVQVLSSITEVQFAVNSAHCSCQVLRRNLRADSRPLSAAWTSTNQGSWLITDST